MRSRQSSLPNWTRLRKFGIDFVFQLLEDRNFRHDLKEGYGLTAKEYLRQAYIIDRRLKLDTERLSAARSALYGKAARYGSDGSKPVPRGNVTESAVLRVMELEERLAKEIDELTEKRREIERAVNAVPDEVQREVLTRRYLLYQKWEVIAEEMNYGVRHVHKIHLAALQCFPKLEK